MQIEPSLDIVISSASEIEGRTQPLTGTAGIIRRLSEGN